MQIALVYPQSNLIFILNLNGEKFGVKHEKERNEPSP